MLQFNPAHVACPQAFKLAEWERQLRSPQGYPLTAGGQIATNINQATIPLGVKCHNAWRRPGVGRSRSKPRGTCSQPDQPVWRHSSDDDQPMVGVLDFLKRGTFSPRWNSSGARERRGLLQVNADVHSAHKLSSQVRLHCEVCGEVGTGTRPMPCPRCHGMLVRWIDAEIDQNRTVQRIRKKEAIPLVAKEHTAQVTTGERAEIEEKFKAQLKFLRQPVFVLAARSKWASTWAASMPSCYATSRLVRITMLNAAVVQDGVRGVGMVVGFARSTPHDQYFYDKPREMIAGEVPVPVLRLGNRDVILRHLYAIAFGAGQSRTFGEDVRLCRADRQPQRGGDYRRSLKPSIFKRSMRSSWRAKPGARRTHQGSTHGDRITEVPRKVSRIACSAYSKPRLGR